MPSPSSKPVAVLGGGLAGLTAANFLHRHGVAFLLFEANQKLAGLASSNWDADGFCYDMGAHLITNRLAKTIGIEEECQTVARHGEAVYLGGRFHSYPLGLLRFPRYALGAIRARMARILEEKPPPDSAAAWFRQQYGKVLAEEVAIPLVEAWSGVPASDLSPEVGEKLPCSLFRTIWLRIAARLTGLPVACGYAREVPESAGVWHVYPTRGVGRLCEKLAESLHSFIRLNSPVSQITVANDRVKSVICRGEEIECSAVISTAPLNVLPSLVRGTDKLEPLRQFAYRPMVFVNLRLQGRDLLPQPVVWTPGKDLPFFRLSEPPASAPQLAPAEKTVIMADIGCQVNDAIWSMSDEALGELCLEGVVRLLPDARQRYLGCKVLRTPVAYPIYHRCYEAERRRQESGTGVEGLYSIGRNGGFAHILMEDVHLLATRAARSIVDHLAAARASDPALPMRPYRDAFQPETQPSWAA